MGFSLPILTIPTIVLTALVSHTDNNHNNTSGHLLQLWMNWPHLVPTVLIPVSILKSKLKVHHRCPDVSNMSNKPCYRRQKI